MASTWRTYDPAIMKVLKGNPDKDPTYYAKILLDTEQSKYQNNDVGMLARYIARHRKRLLDLHEGIYDATDALDVSSSNVKHLWLKDKTKSIFVKNPEYVEKEIDDINKLRDSIILDLQNYKPKFPKMDRRPVRDSHLLVLDPADIHIGKLCSAIESGEDYGSQIAIQRVREGVRGILDKASSFNIDKINFIGGNDILHTDNPKRTTTSGTPQDTDLSWHENFIIAKDIYIEILETLIAVADVHFTFNPSNHDYMSGYFLAQVIEAYFSNCKNITFDNSIAYRKYFRYHNNLIGTTHGDGAKMTDLALLMAHESKDWTDCKHRYFYVHHLHHKWSKDSMSVCIEGLRSQSGTDSWHHKHGYQHAPKAVEGFVHNHKHGQIGRFTHLF